jgi:amino-acid N-acetyltransferase
MTTQRVVPNINLIPTVQPAEADDADAIAELLERRAPETIPVPADQIRDEIDNYLVIRAAGRIQATAALLPVEDDDRLELRSVAVNPDFSGHGLGTRIVGAIQREARLRGKGLLCVTTSPAFFARFGFEPVSSEIVPPKPERDELPTAKDPVTMAWKPCEEQDGAEARHDDLRRSA